MKIALRTPLSELAPLVPEFKARPLSFTGTTDFRVRQLQSAPLGPARDLRGCNLDFLFAYEIFPPRILRFCAEWQLENRSMQPGDVIVQRAQFPPGWGLHLIFGVRVVSVFHEKESAGFSYGTLQGHPEAGTNQFAFSVLDGSIVASVQTAAALASPLVRMLAPLGGRYVNYCNRKALRVMANKFVKSNGDSPPPASSAAGVG